MRSLFAGFKKVCHGTFSKDTKCAPTTIERRVATLGAIGIESGTWHKIVRRRWCQTSEAPSVFEHLSNDLFCPERSYAIGVNPTIRLVAYRPLLSLRSLRPLPGCLRHAV